MKRLTAVSPSDLIEEAVKDPLIEAQIIDLNQKQLYEQGVEADGTPTGQYALRTIAEKEAIGARSDHVTLHDTGAFYDSMQIKAEGASVRIEGDMVKPDRDLEEGWPKALGLTPESLEEIKPDIEKAILRAWKKRLD